MPATVITNWKQKWSLCAPHVAKLCLDTYKEKYKNLQFVIMFHVSAILQEQLNIFENTICLITFFPGVRWEDQYHTHVWVWGTELEPGGD